MTHAQPAGTYAAGCEPDTVKAASPPEGMAINCSPAELLQALPEDLVTTLSMLRDATPAQVTDTVQLLGTGSRTLLEGMDAITQSDVAQQRAPVVTVQPLLFSLIEAAPTNEAAEPEMADILARLNGFANGDFAHTPTHSAGATTTATPSAASVAVSWADAATHSH